MSESFSWIEKYFVDFSEGVERCRTATAFNAADWQDTYNRLNRLRERYKKERANLSPSEQTALAKVFEQDNFIEGLLNIRQIGEHVQKRTPPIIPVYTKTPITLHAETSAGAVFGAPIVRLTDTKGELHQTDHLHNLEEAENRIRRALARAKNTQP
jgi:hypothetical protein